MRMWLGYCSPSVPSWWPPACLTGVVLIAKLQVANLAVLYRALPLVAWHVAAGKAAYLVALAALLAWNLLARKSYVRWRSVVYTALRLHAFLDPNSRFVSTGSDLQLSLQ